MKIEMKMLIMIQIQKWDMTVQGGLVRVEIVKKGSVEEIQKRIIDCNLACVHCPEVS